MSNKHLLYRKQHKTPSAWVAFVSTTTTTKGMYPIFALSHFAAFIHCMQGWRKKSRFCHCHRLCTIYVERDGPCCCLFYFVSHLNVAYPLWWETGNIFVSTLIGEHCKTSYAYEKIGLAKCACLVEFVV